LEDARRRERFAAERLQRLETIVAEIDVGAPRQPAYDDGMVVERGSELPTPEAFSAELDSYFEREVPDHGNTSARLREVEATMAADRELYAGVYLEDVSCVESTCRAVFTHDSESATSRLRGSGQRLFPWAASGFISAQGDGRTVVYSSESEITTLFNPTGL